jgi:hypothetical protein
MMKYFAFALACLAAAAPLSAEPASERARPIAEYLMEEAAEVALAISAAPPKVGAEATVYVLRATGHQKVRDGSNGFTCVVQRGWSSPLMARVGPDFFTPKLRAPICYNPSASRTIFPEYLRRTELAIARKTADEMRSAILQEIGAGTLRPPVIPAMAYMLSAGQWIGTKVEHWHPHVMLYLPFADASAIGGEHGLESGLPLPFDHMGSSFATFVMQAKDFVPVNR